MHYSEFDNSMPLNVDLDTDNDSFKELFQQIEADVSPAFDPKKYLYGRYSPHLKLVLLNLLRAFRQNRGRYVAYHRSRKWFYPQRVGAQGVKLSYEPMMKIVEALADKRYIETKRGVHFKNRSSISRMRATDKLRKLLQAARDTFPDENTIVLSNIEGDRISYQETQETRRMRANLEKINQRLEHHFIGLYVPDDQDKAIAKKLLKKKLALDCSKVRLHRSFNRGSFDLGGRFHGAWWITLPKEFRPFIRIDHEETVERDFTGTSINLAYLALCLDLPTDDVYMMPEVTHERGRDFMKDIAQAILNSCDRGTAIKAIQSELNRGGSVHIPLTAEEVLDRFVLKHAPIRHMFLRDAGLSLQRREADLAEAILLRLADKGIPALPVHDAFLVKKSDANYLETTMIEEVKVRYGRPLPFKAGKKSPLEFLHLGGEDERVRYAGYFQYWDEWLQEHPLASDGIVMAG
ncbi:hypothetical protein [Geomonas ferrireducens]|uniref:hypothetical protein n=1 Tax=Geomonas ferrireducens TaxID=2570227 RepID=UPI0010A7BFDB|nr:hypothetical protein [Geomonas ferrireducens]